LITKNRITLLIDLDDTIILEEQSAQNALLQTVKLVLKHYDVSSLEFVSSVRNQARILWQSLPTYPFCKSIGISSWEGLWGNFTGEDPNLKRLNALKDDYQVNSWNNALKDYNIHSIRLARELSETFNRERRKQHVWFPEAEGVLGGLHLRYSMGLITNGAPDIQWEKIKGCHVEPYFDLILISGEVHSRKPEKKIFEKAISFFNKDRSSFIMIGNSLRSDILGAKNAGIISVWINRKRKIIQGDVRPDYEIDNLEQIFSIITKHEKKVGGE